MEAHGIIPEIIDTKPSALAKVVYPGGVTVELGKELTPTQVKDQPEVSFDAEDGSLYTLFLIDPDVPVEYRDICHWLVINIPGSDVAKGQTVIEYVGSGPSKESGLHRYVFLVFKQTDKITTDLFVSKTSQEKRGKAKTRDYIAKFKLGAPVAGNLFKAQYDDYVPTVRAQVGLA